MTVDSRLPVALSGDPADTVNQALAVFPGQVLKFKRLRLRVLVRHFSIAFLMTATWSIAPPVTASAVTR